MAIKSKNLGDVCANLVTALLKYSVINSGDKSTLVTVRAYAGLQKALAFSKIKIRTSLIFLANLGRKKRSQMKC